MIYNNVPQVIAAIKATAALYPNVNAFLRNPDYASWQKKLEAATDFEAELFAAPTYNILNLLATVGLEQQHSQLPQQSTAMITNLENWLGMFPQLRKDKTFPGKLKNLDKDSFLSTLSELILATYCHNLGFSVKFEHKFVVPGRDGRPDLDLTISNNTIKALHLEVYSPRTPAENGFGATDDLDISFSKKTAFKMDDKFGQAEVTGLEGKVLLAVDTQKVDMLRVKEVLTGQNNNDLYISMAQYLPTAVDGYLFFRGDITAPQSFIFEKLVLK